MFIFLDMDGTIIHRDYSGRFLCLLNGVTQEQILATEAPEAQGKIDWMDGDRLRARMMRGLALEAVEENIHKLAIIGGLADFLAEVKAMGFTPVLASAGPSAVARALAARFGFEHWFASHYSEQNGQLTGEISDFISAGGKAQRVRELCDLHLADPARCIAVGDGDSDVKMFGAVGCSIALNPQPAAEKAAGHAVRTDDIRDLLPIIRRFAEKSPADS